MTDQTPHAPQNPSPEPPHGDRADGWANAQATYGPFPPPPFPPSAKVRRRGRARTRPVVAVGLVAGTLAASAVVGHELWPASAAPTATAASGTGTTSPGLASPGLASPGTGGSGGSGASGASGSGSPISNTEGAGAPADVSSIASKVDPGVVDVWTTMSYQGAEGAGTGIVLTPNGEILTNNHVVDGATSVKVTDIGNGRTYSANVVGYDPSHDVAVLQLVGASGLKTAAIGDSSRVKVGQPVVAVGNAGGTGGTPSAAGGSITALNRSITASDQLDGASEQLSNLIETNADVQSGDSGGPLVTSSGQVIGMDSAASSGYSLQSLSAGSSQGYAIPINQALSIADQIESGRPSSTVHIGPTAFLGVMISSSSSPYSGLYGSYPGASSSSQGATVGQVVQGGAAQAAGLAAGDVITAVDGRAVTSASALSQAVSGDRPGESIRITWIDPDGASHTATATLQSGPPA